MHQSFEVRMHRRCKISSIHRRAEVFLHLSHTYRNWKLIVRTHPLLRCLDVLGTHDAASHSIYAQRYSQVSTAKMLENLAFCCSGHEEARKSCMSYGIIATNACKMTVNTQSTLSQHYSQHYSQRCQNAGKSSILLFWTLRSKKNNYFPLKQANCGICWFSQGFGSVDCSVDCSVD